MRPSVRPSSVSHVRFWVMSYTLHLVHCLSPAKGLANTQEHQTPSNRDRCQILLRDHVRKQHNRSEDNGRSSPTKDLSTSCDKVAQRQCRQMDVCVCVVIFLVCVCVCVCVVCVCVLCVCVVCVCVCCVCVLCVCVVCVCCVCWVCVGCVGCVVCIVCTVCVVCCGLWVVCCVCCVLCVVCCVCVSCVCCVCCVCVFTCLCVCLCLSNTCKTRVVPCSDRWHRRSEHPCSCAVWRCPSWP